MNHLAPVKPLFDVALAPEITPLDTGAIIAIVLAAAAATLAVIFIVRARRKKKTDAPTHADKPE